MSEPTMLVTGGAGFIGGHFIRQVLREDNWRIVNLDKLTYAGNLEALESADADPRYSLVTADIADRAAVLGVLRSRRPQAIVNFAAESHVDRSIDQPRGFLTTNVLGAFELLDAALEYFLDLATAERDPFRFLHVSTDEVYGSLGGTGRFTEQSPYAPNSPYSASKASSDHFVRAYHATYQLPTLITNCSNNYGPYQFPEKLIPLVTLNALEGKPLPVYGRGDQVREWLHVEDHCRAIRRVLRGGRPGETYNIGGDCELANLEVVKHICRIVDRLDPALPHRPCESLIEFVEDRPGHDARYAIDASKTRRELGWRPQFDFDSGLEQTVRWYAENRGWAARATAGKYQRQRLGSPREQPSEPASRCTFTSSRANATLPRANAMPPRANAMASTNGKMIYRDGPIAGVVFKPLARNSDHRGWLIELYRRDELPAGNLPQMAYVSLTAPGVVRGPHEHAAQADHFAFLGPGDLRLYLWDARRGSPTYGRRLRRTVGESDPQAVIVPPGVVHAYENIGHSPAWVFNAPNRLYAGENRREAVDEIRHEEDAGAAFALF